MKRKAGRTDGEGVACDRLAGGGGQSGVGEWGEKVGMAGMCDT